MPDTAARNCYEALGVAKDAGAKAIKDAFRTLALKYHPDRNKEPGAKERFKEIAEAYARDRQEAVTLWTASVHATGE